MSLTIEDGSIVTAANSYATVAEADTYLSLMGVSQWATLATDAKEAKLAQARLIVDDGSTYIYDGDRVSALQTGEWPRAGANYGRSGPVVASDTIPGEIKRAQIVAAGGLSDGTISFGSGTVGATGLVKTRTVDTLSVTYFSPKETGTDAAQAGSAGPFVDLGWPSITAIVAPLLDIEAYEDAAPSAATDGGGIDPDVAARRGPMFTRPLWERNIWEIGQNDSVRSDGRSELLSDQQV